MEEQRGWPYSTDLYISVPVVVATHTLPSLSAPTTSLHHALSNREAALLSMSFAPPPLLTTPAFLNPPTPTSRPRTALARPPRMSLSSSDRPALVHEPVVYNVALGSNMDAAKLVSRKNSDGTFIAPLDDGVPCTVRDWAMTFDYLAMPPREPVMSCGVPRKGDVLHGVLYKLSNESYQAVRTCLYIL